MHASCLVVAVVVPCVLVAGGACTRTPRGEPDAPRAIVAIDDTLGGEWFTDRAAEAGLAFTHFNGMSGAFYEVELFAPGVALLDYDNDGDLDVYVVQGQMLGAGNTLPGASAPPAGVLGDRLFRNDLEVRPDGTRTLRFTDVTEASRINVTSYGMGVAAADIDNDNWTDLYLTRFGANVMLRNNGDGTFTDVSARSGSADESWSVSAAFLDYDRDGWLDLYVGNYLSYTVATDQQCTSLAGQADYCPPVVYRSTPDRLYRNRGDGTFEDSTARARMTGSSRPTLGVATADFDGDGWMDIYVANDGTENVLWINGRDGTFTDAALLAGAALTADGNPEASMGVDAGDFDNDGDEDLFIANQTSEGHTLYGNDGTARFEDWGRRSGVRPSSLAFTGFGAAWIDVDNDGWLDILTTNGGVRIVEALARQGDPSPYVQTPQLLLNLRNGRFEDASARAGAAFRTRAIGRGAAFGDVDNDGDLDVVVGANNGPAQLLVNNIGSRNHWVGLRLLGRDTARDMVGARVGITRADGRTYWRRARSDGSYGSANDPRVLVGLGATSDIVSATVIWPGGATETWDDVSADRWNVLKEGGGRSGAGRR